MGELWWFCLLPTSLTSVNKKNTPWDLALVWPHRKGLKVPIRWGWDHCSGKKKHVLIFHTIKLDWNLTYYNLFDTKERQPFWKIPFCWASSLLSFIHVTSSWQATITMILRPFWKKCQPLFLPPFFFSNKPILYQPQQLTDPASKNPSSPDAVTGDITNALGA